MRQSVRTGGRHRNEHNPGAPDAQRRTGCGRTRRAARAISHRGRAGHRKDVHRDRAILLAGRTGRRTGPDPHGHVQRAGRRGAEGSDHQRAFVAAAGPRGPGVGRSLDRHLPQCLRPAPRRVRLPRRCSARDACPGRDRAAAVRARAYGGTAPRRHSTVRPRLVQRTGGRRPGRPPAIRPPVPAQAEGSRHQSRTLPSPSARPPRSALERAGRDKWVGWAGPRARRAGSRRRPVHDLSLLRGRPSRTGVARFRRPAPRSHRFARACA